jgi:hypothetical protein
MHQDMEIGIAPTNPTGKETNAMRYWRMAMREGNQGRDRFDAYRARGVAAIDYSDDHDRRIVTDCRQLTLEAFEDTWRRKQAKATSSRASLRHLWRDMRKGDIIYAKKGTEVVGKGRIIKGYAYDPALLRGEFGASTWAHYVSVRWETRFVSFHFPFDAQQHAIFELTGSRLAKVQKAERVACGQAGRRVTLPVDALSDDLASPEGHIRKVMVVHRQREHRLREAKIRQAMVLGGGQLRCEVPGCGFGFFETYGDLGREFAFVHHLKGLAARQKPSLTRLSDLAIVCGNCHAMIHLGGECRQLDGLIPRRRGGR